MTEQSPEDECDVYLAIINIKIAKWKKFINEFGEDAEVAVYTLLAELDEIKEQMIYGSIPDRRKRRVSGKDSI